MKKLIAVIFVFCAMLSATAFSVFAVDTPYKGLNKGEMWKLEEFAPYKLLVNTHEKIDPAEYTDKTDFEFYGVYIKSVTPVIEHDENYEFGEKYVYEVIVDRAKNGSAIEACETLESHENVISASGFVMSMYGFGDVDENGAQDQYDYILVQRIYFGTYAASDLELGYADMDFDGEITPYDCILSRRTYFGTFFPYSSSD